MLKSVKIGCYSYCVEEVPQVSKTAALKGQIDHFARVIRIDRDMSRCDKIEALIHEAIHGIDEFMHLNLSENLVGKLGVAVAMVLMDNPDLCRLAGGPESGSCDC